mmetsp:Transcript_139127/g.432878  ORF Transcript_139127/g.432878 Transcript_139127/m.432878 type:complete len:312 (+) Transcript_139127:1393-2328(+)
MRALQQVIHTQDGSAMDLSQRVGGLQRLRERQVESVADAADENHCTMEPMDPPVRDLLRGQLGRAITDCSDIKQHCDEGGIVGVRARQACPRTCGCSALLGRPLFHRDPSLGCGRKCMYAPEWVNDGPIECTDVSVGLASEIAWLNFVRASTGRVFSSAGELEFLTIAAGAFNESGRGAVGILHANYSRDLCLDANTRPVVLAMCPTSCGCMLHPQEGCPLVCFTQRYGAKWKTVALNTRDVAKLSLGFIFARRRRTSTAATTTPWRASATAGATEENASVINGATATPPSRTGVTTTLKANRRRPWFGLR